MKRFLVAGLLLLAGCASVPFPETPLVPTAQKSAAELSGSLWTKGEGTLLIRQSALFEFRGVRVPLDGMMSLDLRNKSARLVGMNDLGVKLYDLTVDPSGTTTHSVIPELARYPRFSEAVGDSVRRIFLAPEPGASDRLEVGRDSYLLTREEGGRRLRFVLGGDREQILEKSCRGKGESWRVRYYRYRTEAGRAVPGGIVLDDDEAGYRLTLWIESVEKSDE